MHKKLIAILSLLLAGCIPVAFIAGAGAGSVLIKDKRAVKIILEDRDIVNQALIKLSRNRQLRIQSHISIACLNNILLITGQAPTSELRRQALSLVSSDPRIKRIYNEISIEPPTSQLVQTNDSWLTTKVKTAMVAEKGLDSHNIKVVTENGTVYLMGLIDKDQADLAASIARGITGVQKVVKIFEYQS